MPVNPQHRGLRVAHFLVPIDPQKREVVNMSLEPPVDQFYAYITSLKNRYRWVEIVTVSPCSYEPLVLKLGNEGGEH